jgi:serine protease Do
LLIASDQQPEEQLVSALTELRDVVVTAADRTGPSVVAIGRGAGMIIHPGAIATNAHNLRGESAEVAFADGSTTTARLLGIDRDGDLAVLAADTGDRPAVTWADSQPGLGEVVVAIGAPRHGPSRVAAGFVSAADRRFRGPGGRPLTGLEHTAPIGRGASGGPLVDAAGAVVAIDTHRLGDGTYLAVPVTDVLRERLTALQAGASPRRRRVGIAVTPARASARLRAAVGLSDRPGVLVREVEEGSPAQTAGLREGDLITGADGTDVASHDDLLLAIDRASTTLQLQVVRGEDEREVSIALDA